MKTSFSRISIVALTLGIFAMMMFGVTSAVAQSDFKERAKQYLAEGLVAQDQGRLDDAIALYNQAYELVPHSEILFNLGQAYRLKGDRLAAVSYYRKYLAVDIKYRVSKAAEAWIKKLEKEILLEEVRKAEEARKSEHARKAEEENKAEEERKAEEARKAEEEREVEEARRAEKEHKAEEQRRIEQARTSEETDQPEASGKVMAASAVPDTGKHTADSARGFTGKRKLALILGSTAVVSLGAALAFELSSMSSYEVYERMPDGALREDQYDKANRKHRLAQGLSIAGVTCGLVTGYLWFSGAAAAPDQRRRSTRVMLFFPLGGAGVAVTAGF